MPKKISAYNENNIHIFQLWNYFNSNLCLIWLFHQSLYTWLKILLLPPWNIENIWICKYVWFQKFKTEQEIYLLHSEAQTSKSLNNKVQFSTAHSVKTVRAQGANYLRALIVVRPSTVSEKWESKGSWVLSSSCCRSLTRRQRTQLQFT